MLAYAAIPLTCWLCALIAAPRKPRVGNEVAELVYMRLLGRQQRLGLLAAVATAALFFALAITLPQRIMDDAGAAPATQVAQLDMAIDQQSCYAAQQDPTFLWDIAGPPTLAGKPQVCKP